MSGIQWPTSGHWRNWTKYFHFEPNWIYVNNVRSLNLNLNISDRRKRSFIKGIILLYVDYNLNHVSNRRPAAQMWPTKSFFITQQCTIFVTSINSNQFHKHLLKRKFDPPGLNYNVQRWMTKTSTSKSAYVLSGGEFSLTFLSWTLGSFSVLISLVTVLAVEVEPLSE